MKKNKFYFNKILVALVLIPLQIGCSSNDDGNISEPEPERTIIVMEPPTNSEVDWNDVELVYNEEFSESTNLDNIWSFENKDFDSPHFANGLQSFRKENVDLNGGKLKIYAREKEGVYTSARLSGKQAFKYGRIEISAKLPNPDTKGLWAKIGLLGNNIDEVGWPQCGEIDIMEYFTNSPDVIYNYIHSNANNNVNGTLISSSYNVETAEEEFHAYGILWTDTYIKFYVDNPNNVTYTFLRPSPTTDNNWPFDQPFFLLTHMVIGGDYGGEGVDASLFPAVMEIDYIRVYHLQ